MLQDLLKRFSTLTVAIMDSFFANVKHFHKRKVLKLACLKAYSPSCIITITPHQLISNLLWQNSCRIRVGRFRGPKVLQDCRKAPKNHDFPSWTPLSMCRRSLGHFRGPKMLQDLLKRFSTLTVAITDPSLFCLKHFHKRFLS